MLDLAHEKAQEEQSRIDDWDLAETPPPDTAPEPPPDMPLPAAPAVEEVWNPEPETSKPTAGPGQSPQEADPPALDWTEAVLPDPAPPAPEGATPPDRAATPDVAATIAAMMQAATPPPVAPPAAPAPVVPTPVTPTPVAPTPVTPTPSDPVASLVQAIEPGSADVGPAPKAGAVPRRPLDETLLAILREEAEREAAARRAEGTGLETQEEMNLDAGPVAVPPPPPTAAPPAATAPPPPQVPPAPPPPPRPTARVTPQRPPLDFSDLSSEDDDLDRAADLTEGPEPGPRGGRVRRQQLPDIEEINSSLRASADRGNDAAALGAAPGHAEGRAGFRLGFSLVMLVAALAALLYAYAPRLAVAVPALTPLLDTYVALANAARFWLDEQLRAVITQVQSRAL